VEPIKPDFEVIQEGEEGIMVEDLDSIGINSSADMDLFSLNPPTPDPSLPPPFPPPLTMPDAPHPADDYLNFLDDNFQ